MQNENERGANSRQSTGRGGLFSGTVGISRPLRYEHVFFQTNVSLKLCRGVLSGKASKGLTAWGAAGDTCIL